MQPLNRLPHVMQDHFMRRVRETEAEAESRKFSLRTRTQALAYQEELRRAFKQVFGPMPRRTALNARITGGFEREDYRVEHVLFESRPGFAVTGNLYIPTNRTLPAPCVLGTCGHSANGKAEKNYQAFCLGLVKKGYVVFIYDPIGQGERVQYPDGKGDSRYGRSVREHIQAGNQQLLVDEWMGTWRVWDGIRALDYLLSRPEVDPAHVGLTGNSGGGTLTTLILACDDRFTMAGPGCYVTTWRRNVENELPADNEQDPPYALALGLDMDDLLALHAPKPLILLTQSKDFFDQRGSVTVYERLKHLYTLLGAPDNVALCTGPGPHGYAVELREAMYGHFNRACGKQREGAKEPPIEVEPDENLWVTPEGHVARLDPAPPTVFTFTRDKALKLQEKRKQFSRADLAKTISRVLALPRRSDVPEYRIMRPLGNRQYSRPASFYNVETEPGIQCMMTMLSYEMLASPIPPGKEAVLYVPHMSADVDLREEPLAKKLAKGAEKLFALDVRGSGESQPNTCGLDTFLAPYGCDYFYAYLHSMYGESYVGRRVFDLLRVIDLLEKHGYKSLHLAGCGWGGPIALMTAVIDSRVKHLTLKNTLWAYEDLALDEDYIWPLSGVIKGVLKHFDLPDCRKALGKKMTETQPWNSRCKVQRTKR